jgi:hypothetical protein
LLYEHKFVVRRDHKRQRTAAQLATGSSLRVLIVQIAIEPALISN